MANIAIVGAGNWGRNLVRIFGSLPRTQLKYICDRQEKVRLSMARTYPGATTLEDIGPVLADPGVEAVVIAVDAPRHYELAKACLAAGKHVYVEKPLTLQSGQAAELVELAAVGGRVLMVGHLLEYHPAVGLMKRMIDTGEVGRSLYLYFQRVNLGIVRDEENAWWSLAPHDVAVACYLFDAQPISVSAAGHGYLRPTIEDVVFASLTFADGRMAHIHVSWLDPHKIRKVTLVGSRRMVVFDDMDAAEKVRIYDKGADVRRSVENYAEAITLRTGDILIPQLPSAEPLKIECEHFIECITTGRQPTSDGADGLRVVRVLEAGACSLAKGGEPVQINAQQTDSRPAVAGGVPPG